MSAKTNPSNASQCDCPEKMHHHSILYTLLSSGTSSTTTPSPSSSPPAPSPSPSTNNSDCCETQMKEEKQEQMSGMTTTATSTTTASPTTPTTTKQEAIYSTWDCTLRAPLHPAHTLPTIIKLKYAEEVCPYVAHLLVKTVDFIRNLPSTLCLSRHDRVRLIQHCWSELLILTMAQYQFHIEVDKIPLRRDTPTPADSNPVGPATNVNSKSTAVALSSPVAKSCPEKDCREGALVKYIIATQGIPTTSDTDVLNTFFQKCQTLRIDDKEFAYLKATIFFNPDVRGLSNSGLVETLRGHAQLQLSEYVTARHPREPLRFAHLLLGLPPLRNVRPRVVTRLFFRDLIGESVEMEEVVRQMLTGE